MCVCVFVCVCTQCSYDFCWVCLDPWHLHDHKTGGYFTSVDTSTLSLLIPLKYPCMEIATYIHTTHTHPLLSHTTGKIQRCCQNTENPFCIHFRNFVIMRMCMIFSLRLDGFTPLTHKHALSIHLLCGRSNSGNPSTEKILCCENFHLKNSI